ncbi:MAG: hypothetical protein LC808_32375, partial [Actinobacteria bacterium]|nr:hypothetical protein [Actinomycetota bacterium]
GHYAQDALLKGGWDEPGFPDDWRVQVYVPTHVAHAPSAEDPPASAHARGDFDAVMLVYLDKGNARTSIRDVGVTARETVSTRASIRQAIVKLPVVKWHRRLLRREGRL